MDNYNPLKKYGVTHDMIQAMRKFRDAAFELQDKWDMVDGDCDAVCATYPFHRSFNELTTLIAQWVDDVIKTERR